MGLELQRKLATEGLATSAQPAGGSSAAWTGPDMARAVLTVDKGSACSRQPAFDFNSLAWRLLFLLVLVLQDLFTEILEGPSGHLDAQWPPRCPAQSLS